MIIYIYISTIIHEQTYIYIYICIMYVYLYMMRSYVRLYKYKSAGPGRRQGGARQGREVRNNNSNNNNNIIIIIHNIIHNLNSNPNHNPNHDNQKHVKNMGQPQKESQSCKVEGFKTTRSTKGSQEMQNTPKMHLF